MKPLTKINIVYCSLIVIFTLILIMFSLGYVSNKNRISEIQESRISSCKRTYNALPEIIKALPLTVSQEHQLKDFNQIIDKFVKECEEQVKP